MVKNAILIISLLILAACSGKGTDVELKVSKSFAIATQNGGGAVLYINNTDTKDTKTIVVDKEEVTITLLNGNWDFSVVTWDGATPLAGELACAKQSAVLKGEKVEIDLDPTIHECKDLNFSRKPVSFVNCHTLAGITPGETCDSLGRGQAGSYQIRFENVETKGLSSVCIQAEADPISTVDTHHSLPFNYIKDFKFDVFSDASCSTGKKTFSYHEAFSDEGTLYFAYGGVASYPPIASNINPPVATHNIESMITLSYVDYNLDLATSCSVSNLNYLTVSTPCTCTLGVCKVGVLETTNFVGDVGFDYTVTANGQVSNTASVSFFLNEPPEPDYAPEALGIMNGGNFAFSSLAMSLPYSDANSDYATSCEITSYTGPITPGTCSCSAGQCIITIYPNGYGLASFEYKVTANGLDSNIALVSLSIIEAPVLEYAPNISAFFGQNISVGPTSLIHNGEIATCTISPDLPTGLTFDPYSCIISGTAATILNPTVYTVVATNSAGPTSTNFTFEIKALLPTVDYTAALMVDFYKGMPLNINPILNETGSPIMNCSVTPSLPIGLTIDNNNCAISGIPYDKSNQTYTVIVQNAAGTVNVPLTLKIQSAFATEWELTYPGDLTITLPLVTGKIYDIKIDWGDGSGPTILSGPLSTAVSHSYSAMGVYSITIYGNIPLFKFNGVGDTSKIRSITQWGTSKWESMEHAFFGCSQLQVLATDAPDLSLATSLLAMFRGASTFNGSIGHWDTSNITDMSYMFQYANSFNQDISGWNTSNVTNMTYMFDGATSFSGFLNTWDVSKVTNMEGMFAGAYSFNSPLNMWNTSQVTNMKQMFLNNSGFNQDIGMWDTSKVTNMESMFSSAVNFNQDLSQWNIGLVVEFNYFSFSVSAWNPFLQPTF